MAYNRINHLKKIKRIQDIYMKYKEDYVTNRFIFNRHIKPFYDISESTFYNYLNIKNPSKQIEKIEQQNQNRLNKKKVAGGK